MIKQALNKHGFKTWNAQPPYFVSAFPNYVLQSELPRFYKVPNLLNL